MTRNDIENAWWKYVRSMTNLDQDKIIFSEELTRKDGPRPKPPFITIKILSGPTPIGIDELRVKEGFTDKFQLQGLRQYTVSIQSFGVEGYDLLDDLQTSLDDSERTRQLYVDAEIAIVSRGVLTDITALMETGHEKRSALDIVFNTNKKLDTSMVPIEHVGFTGTLEGAGAGEQIIGPEEVDKP